MAEITIGLAFIAGLVSFISPCVLPLVPAYVGYMGGQVTTRVAAIASGSSTAVVSRRNRFNTVLHGIFFVLGFTFVFVTFGLVLTAGSFALRGTVIEIQDILTRLGGIIIILFGLHVMGYLPKFINWVLARTGRMNSGNGLVLTIAAQLGVAVLLAWSLVTPVPAVIGAGLFLLWLAWGGAFVRPGTFWQGMLTRLQNLLYADTRQQMEARGDRGYAGSALMGVVFSAGWTPCIGPVYGAILTLAANGGSLGEAGAMLAAYSLGLGVPFLLTALALDQMQGLLRRLQRHMRKIELASGAFLVLIGLLVLTGRLEEISQIGASGEFSVNLEHCTTELFSGHIGIGDFGACMEVGLNFDPQADAEALPAGDTAGEGEAAAASLLDGLNDLSEDSPVAVLLDEGLGEGFLAPAFETTTLSGQPIALTDSRGQVTVVNFWATWCGPCRIEMPHLQAAYEELADDGLEILAIDRDEAPGQVEAFRDENGLTFPILLDPGEAITAVQYQVISMPTTFVLDRNGVIVARHLGPLTAEQLAGYLDTAFAAVEE